MNPKINFSIPGEPGQKDRARALPYLVYDDYREPQAKVRLVTPPETVNAERLVRESFRKAHPGHRILYGPVMISFTAVFQTPKSFNKALQAAAARGELYCTKKPDKDNIEKLIVDALNGVAWGDDAQVMGGGIKRYGSPARIDVTIRSLENPNVPPTPGQRKQEAKAAAPLPLLARVGKRPPQHNARSTRAAPPASGTGTPVVNAPDLSDHSPHAQTLIMRALEREERSRLDRLNRK